jgi:hypothetical protein
MKVELYIQQDIKLLHIIKRKIHKPILQDKQDIEDILVCHYPH